MIRQLESKDSTSYYNIRLEALRLNPEAFGACAKDWSKAADDQIKTLLEKSNPDDFVLGYFQDIEI